MAVIQVKIPEKLWQRLQQTGRPVEDVIVEALEKSFEAGSTATEKHPSRQEIIRQLIESGTVINPDTWDDPYAQAWLARPEDERDKLIQEMNQEWHPGSQASNAVIEGRR
jgi:hypothetical protein